MLSRIKKQGWLVIPSVVAVIFLVIYVFQLSVPESIVAHQVRKDNILVSLTITGEVRADNTVNVTAPIQSRIQKIWVDDGDLVKPGQVLVQLDSDDLQASYLEAQAQAEKERASLAFVLQGTRKEELKRLENSAKEVQKQIESARAEYEKAQRFAQRMEPLHQDGAISDNEYDNALTQVENTKANLSSAKFRLAQMEDTLEKGRAGPTQPEVDEARSAYQAAHQRTNTAHAKLQDQNLISNLSGIVLARLQEPGEIAQPNQPILKIADQNTLEVVGYVEEVDLSRIRLGDACYVVLDAEPETPLKGKIQRIGSEVNPENGTVEIKIGLILDTSTPSPSIALLPGMTADINVITDTLTESMVVPSTALYKDKNQFWAFKLVDNHIEKTAVQARRVSLEYFQIVEGLQPDDWIARTATPDLLEKKQVQPVPFDAIPASSPANKQKG